MKTLRSNAGSFGVQNFNTNGTPYYASTDNYTSANDINKFSIYRVTGTTGDSSYLAGLPNVENISGTLITLPYSDTRGSQIFIRYNTSTTTGVYVRHKFTDGQWLGWKLLDGTDVE